MGKRTYKPNLNSVSQLKSMPAINPDKEWRGGTYCNTDCPYKDHCRKKDGRIENCLTYLKFFIHKWARLQLKFGVL